MSESRITVRYAETDQMGIAHHSVYPVWYEVARTDFIKRLEMTYSEMERRGVMLPLIGLSCHYRGVAKYEDELCVRVRVSLLSVSRIEFSYAIYRVGEEKPINTGTTLHGWVDSGTFRPMNLKKKHPEIYDLVQSSLGDEAL